MKKTTITLLASLVLFAPALIALAADANAPFQFQPIVSIPLPTGSQSLSVNGQTSLSCYLNAAFKLAIAVSVVLAVIMIIIDGFKYMTSEAIGNKKDALGGIRSAMFGLILLLSSWLILYIINPQILSLSVFSGDQNGLGACGFTVTGNAVTPTTATPGGNGAANPLATPQKGTFGASANPSSSNTAATPTGTTPADSGSPLPSAGEMAGSGNYCFLTKANGAMCSSSVSACNTLHATYSAQAGTDCFDSSTTQPPPIVP